MEYIEEILAFYVLYLYIFSIYTQHVRTSVRTYVHRAALGFPSLWASLRLSCVRGSVALLARSLAASCQLFDRGGGRRPGAQEIRGLGSARTRKKCGRLKLRRLGVHGCNLWVDSLVAKYGSTLPRRRQMRRTRSPIAWQWTKLELSSPRIATRNAIALTSSCACRYACIHVCMYVLCVWCVCDGCVHVCIGSLFLLSEMGCIAIAWVVRWGFVGIPNWGIDGFFWVYVQSLQKRILFPSCHSKYKYPAAMSWQRKL
jgi:hypothetical protein